MHAASLLTAFGLKTLRVGSMARRGPTLFSLLCVALAALASASSIDLFDNQLGDINYCKKQCQITIRNKSPAKVSDTSPETNKLTNKNAAPGALRLCTSLSQFQPFPVFCIPALGQTHLLPAHPSLNGWMVCVVENGSSLRGRFILGYTRLYWALCACLSGRPVAGPWMMGLFSFARLAV